MADTELASADREATRRYPLATKTGIAMVFELLAARQQWERATGPQRRLLRDACAPIVAKLGELDADREGGTETVVGPAPRIHAAVQTLASLRRKGLVNDDGYVTPDTIRAAFWVARWPQWERRYG